MSIDCSVLHNGSPADDGDGGEHQHAKVQVIDTQSGGRGSPDKASKQKALVNGNGAAYGENGKSDSEAETVVLSGKEEGAAKKTIKHEDASDAESLSAFVERRSEERRALHPDKNGQNGMRKPSLKRKRSVQEATTNEGHEGGNSSNLSSAFSSPAPRSRSEKGNGSESERSRASPPANREVTVKKSRLRNRKLDQEDAHYARQRRGKSDPSSAVLSGQERRRKKRVKDLNASTTRSESPPAHQHVRLHSTQAGNIHSGVKRRKAPPSLSIEGRRKVSEDTHHESDDSTSALNRPQLVKSASIDEHAMAKTSHKKILDKSGRTPVARASANDNIEQLAAELKERPHHLNEPDYALNTPLQIAALGGFDDTVQFLLHEGCVVNCKNVDGDTPLIDAVENGHLEVVILLLKAGADPRLRNGKGEEPLDLVTPDVGDDWEAIKDVLVDAKAKEPLRRPSEDQSAGTRDNDGASVSASAGSPTDSTQSKVVGASNEPPRQAGKPGGLGGEAARKRTARSQTTREGLLWISATPERLREAASKGDQEVVGHILNSRPADTESVLVAARGGHEVVLQLLIALGRPESDPDPLQMTEYKAGQNTPMLAAIGGGNVKVIELLLKQPGFDPTRRLYRGLTYYELAKQRQSSSWEQEYSVLKEAYDTYVAEGGKRSTHSSPRKVRTKRPEARPTSPPAPADSGRPAQLSKKSSLYKAYNKKIRPDDEDKDASAVASDREVSTLAAPDSKIKSARSASDAGSVGKIKLEAIFKPRRRLMSKNEISDQDQKRRVSLAEGSSTSSHDMPRRKSSDGSVTVSQDQKERRRESMSTKQESSKKRPRSSTSPSRPRGRGSKSRSPKDAFKKKKRRIHAEGDSTEQNISTRVPRGPVEQANMIASPEPIVSPIKTPGSAPVAFMGGNVAHSPTVRSPVDTRSNLNSPFSSIDRAMQQDTAQTNQSPRLNEQIFREPATTIRSLSENAENKPVNAAAQIDESTTKRQGEETSHEKEAEVTRLKESQAARQREIEAQETERQVQREREEEEARTTKARNEETLARRAEQERQQREKEERRKAELERREEMRRVQLQEEKEMQRREALTNGLRRAAELSPEEARDLEWINKWLPLYTVETEDLDSDCPEEERSERWVANVQVAPLLACKDLALSQCKSFLLSPFPLYFSVLSYLVVPPAPAHLVLALHPPTHFTNNIMQQTPHGSTARWHQPNESLFGASSAISSPESVSPCSLR